MSGGLVEGPYVVAGVEFEPTTFWMQGTELNIEPPCPTDGTMNTHTCKHS